MAESVEVKKRKTTFGRFVVGFCAGWIGLVMGFCTGMVLSAIGVAIYTGHWHG